MSDFWTDQRVERLHHLRRDKWSAGMIAADLGCSRNAVIGKIDRIRNAPSTPRVPPDWNLRKIIILDVQANNLPARAAATRLGLSVDQTRKYAKKLGIPFAPCQGERSGQRATVSLPRAPRVRTAPVVAKTPLVVPDDAIGFMALRDGVADLRGHFKPGTCKFELTNSRHPRDFLFCAADTTPGKPFCSEHNARCFVAVRGHEQIHASRR